MALTIPLNVNGVIYPYPKENAEDWGVAATGWAQAMTVGTLQKQGGTFTLTNDVNFGANFGLLSKYFTSRTASAAAAGQVRLAHADVISWRNNANSADLSFSVNSSDQILFNSLPIGFVGSVSDTSTIHLDVTTSNLTANVISGSLTNTQINASAAIALSKLAAVTASRALVSDGSGFVSASSVTGTELGYVSGVTSAIQTQLNARLTNPITTQGDLILGGSAGSTTRLGIGTNTFVLTSDGTTASWQAAASGFTNPMTTANDIIIGGTAGAAARLAKGSNGTFLGINGSGNVAYGTPIGFANPLTTTGDTMYSSSGSTPARLAIGASGTMLVSNGTAPSWEKRVHAFVMANGAVQNFPSGSAVQVQTNTTLIDTDSYNDLANDQAVIPAGLGGTYVLSGVVGLGSGTAGIGVVDMQILINGNPYAEAGYAFAPTISSGSVYYVVTLAAADVITWTLFQSNGVTRSNLAGSGALYYVVLSGYRIGP